MRFGGWDFGRTTDRSVFAGMEGWLLDRLVIIPHGLTQDQAKIVANGLSGYSAVAVDNTGPGIGAADVLETLLRGSTCVLFRVNIGAGAGLALYDDDDRISVGNAKLYSMLAGAVRVGLFAVSPDCPNRQALRDEMGSVIGRFSARGGLSFGAETGHDDMVMGVALAMLAQWAFYQREKRRHG